MEVCLASTIVVHLESSEPRFSRGGQRKKGRKKGIEPRVGGVDTLPLTCKKKVTTIFLVTNQLFSYYNEFSSKEINFTKQFYDCNCIYFDMQKGLYPQLFNTNKNKHRINII